MSCTPQKRGVAAFAGQCALAGVLGLLGPLLAAAPAAAQGRFRAAGQLFEARVGHTATLLADGRVLVVGGRGADATVELHSAELYDPRASRWSRAGALAAGRAGHTATLLPDGRVLVTGGTGHDDADGGHRYVALASAELYEPRANRWRPAAPMGEARNWHSATLLADGRVLVAGGAREARQHLASAELYDPARDGWAPAAPLLEARCLHQVVAVDGGVLVVGGRSNKGDRDTGYGRPLASAERYEAAAGVWRAAPELSEEKQFHAAVALADGRVLVVAGAAPTMLTNLAEWLSPGGAGWTLAEASLSLGRAHHSASALPSGDVLVVGGETADEVDSDLAQRLDAKTARWCVAGKLQASRKKHTATVLPGGQVLVVGGTSAGLPERLAERWEPAKGACVEPPGPSLEF